MQEEDSITASSKKHPKLKPIKKRQRRRPTKKRKIISKDSKIKTTVETRKYSKKLKDYN